MRRLAVMLATAAMVTTARADVVLGMQYGQQSLAVQQTLNNVLVSDDTLTTESALGLVVGIGMPGGNARIMAEYAAYDLGNDNSLDLFSLGYTQFLPLLKLAPDTGLRAFLGAELGYGTLRMASQPGLGEGSDTRLLYGVHAGLNMAIGNQAEVEVGVRVSEVGVEASQQGVVGDVRTGVSRNQAWWVGVNFGM